MAQTTTARYQDRRDRIVRLAARVFAEKGYHEATMRDVARAARSSLAGLYYYFPSKEEILFAISARALDTVIAGALTSRHGTPSPEDRLRAFVANHLGYFAAHLTEMKVLSRESDALTGAYRREIQERKRVYVALATEIVGGLRPAPAPAPRLAALALFGMMNWIYTWYRTPGDQDATAGETPGIDAIAAMMSDIFLNGILNGCTDGGFMAPGRSAQAPAGAGAIGDAGLTAGVITTTSEKGQG